MGSVSENIEIKKTQKAHYQSSIYIPKLGFGLSSPISLLSLPHPISLPPSLLYLAPSCARGQQRRTSDGVAAAAPSGSAKWWRGDGCAEQGRKAAAAGGRTPRGAAQNSNGFGGPVMGLAVL